MTIFRGTQVVQKLNTEMTIAKLEDGSGFEWSTRYLDKNKMTKPYNLRIIDAKTGHYQIDEGLIKLNVSYTHDTLRGWFTVDNTLIYS